MDFDSDIENQSSEDEQVEDQPEIITIDVGETSSYIISILENLGPFCQKATYEQMKFFLVFFGININFTEDCLQKYKDDGFPEFTLRHIMFELAGWSTTNEIKLKFVAEFLNKISN